MGDENLSLKAREALRQIRNYLMQHGKTPSVRELMAIMEYRSPRSAVLLMEELEGNGFLEKKEDGTYRFIKDIEEGNRTVTVPLVGMVTCGSPILAQENIEAMIPVSTRLAKPGSKYFLLRAKGDSMDEAGINDGDLILIKQQAIANNGQNVVALIDDEATVKEFQRKGNIVLLMPRSTNKDHKPIILDREFIIQGVVIKTIPNINI